MDRVEAKEGRRGQKEVVKELAERTCERKDEETKAKAGDGVILPVMARIQRSQRKGDDDGDRGRR